MKISRIILAVATFLISLVFLNEPATDIQLGFGIVLMVLSLDNLFDALKS